MFTYKSLVDTGRFRLADCLKNDWVELLNSEFEQSYFKHLEAFLFSRMQAGAEIYPSPENIFRALNLTPIEQTRVVVLGQDPYHGPGQAHGLAFSVPPGQPHPPSLANIFRELQTDLGLSLPDDGCLEKWAGQGVLMLNAVLTVERGQARAHRNQGWERFTDKVIETISDYCRDVVFLLWGGDAQKKAVLIDGSRHHVLLAPHPSPLSAYRGFLGCRHFSLCNAFLTARGREPVDWSLA